MFKLLPTGHKLLCGCKSDHAEEIIMHVELMCFQDFLEVLKHSLQNFFKNLEKMFPRY